MSLLFLLSLSSVALLGQMTPAFADPSSVQPTYVLTGTVINSATGEPISRALVQLYAGSERSVLTDFSGAFRFEGLQKGTVSITTRKPGFFTATELNNEPFSPSNVPAPIQIGPNLQAVTLQLVPGGSIVGRVINQDGEGVEDFPIHVFRLRMVDGRKQWEQSPQVRAEDGGKFRVSDLAPGLYSVRVGPSFALDIVAAKTPSTRELIYPALYYPSASDITSATLLSVQAGQETEADFSVRAEPTFHIEGSFSGGGEYPDAELLDSSGDFSGMLRFRPRLGEFWADVARGHYTLRLLWSDNGRGVTTRVPLNVNSDMSGIQVPIVPTPSIAVNIRLESFRPADSPQRSPLQPYRGPPARVELISTANGINPRRLQASVSGARDDGRQQISNADPGRYRVEITPIGGWYVYSATSGGTDLLREELTVGWGGAVPPIEIVLRNDTGRLTGTLRSDQPGTRPGFVLIPENRSSSYAQVGYANTNDGEFTVDAVPPGDYDILAFDRLSGLEYRNPDALAPYRSRAVHVTVARGGTAKVTVEVIHRGEAP